jgi:hypothetical protein
MAPLELISNLLVIFYLPRAWCMVFLFDVLEMITKIMLLAHIMQLRNYPVQAKTEHWGMDGRS